LVVTAGDVVITDGDLVLTAGDAEFGEDVTVTGSIIGVVGVDASGTVSANLFTPDAADGADIGTVDLEFSDIYLADGSIIKLGDDQDVSITHVADTGILLTGTTDEQLQIGDSGTYINQSTDGTLNMVADTIAEITAPNLRLEVDDAAYLNVATADGGATTISQTSDGQDKIILGDGADATQIIIPSGPDDVANGEWSGIAIKGPCGEAIAEFEVVVWTSAANEFMLASATAASGLYPARGIAVEEHNDGWETADGEELTVLVQGVIRNDAWAWGTVGGAIYLGEELNPAVGGLTQTAPSTSNDAVQIVGWAISDDQAYFNFSGHSLLVE